MHRHGGTSGNIIYFKSMCYCYLSSSVDTNQSRMIFLNPWKMSAKLSEKGPVTPHMQVPAKTVGIAASKKGKKKGLFKENE